MNEPKKEEKKAEEGGDDPFSMIKKKKVVKVKPAVAKDEEEDGNSSARKSSKKGKGKKKGGLPTISSNQKLGLVDDGTVPKVIVKENNEAVDLLKQADDKLKKVLEMYVPPKGSSDKSKTSSRRSKSSTGTQKS